MVVVKLVTVLLHVETRVRGIGEEAAHGVRRGADCDIVMEHTADYTVDSHAGHKEQVGIGVQDHKVVPI